MDRLAARELVARVDEQQEILCEERLDHELKLCGEYGLRCKREVG